MLYLVTPCTLYVYVYKWKKRRRNEQLCKKHDCSAVTVAAAGGGDGDVPLPVLRSSWLVGALMMIISYILIKFVCACVRERESVLESKAKGRRTSGDSDGSNITTRRKSGKHYRNTNNEKKNDIKKTVATTAKLTNWLNVRWKKREK